MKDLDYTPRYIYENPMFMITVSTVIIEENGVVLVHDRVDTSKTCACDVYKFSGGTVRAGQESIQFAALRYIKEQTGILVRKDSLIPVDFRSDPERSKSGNIVDIGFVTILEGSRDEQNTYYKHGKWIEVDFEKRKLRLDDISKLSNETSVLLQRALDIALMIKD